MNKIKKINISYIYLIASFLFLFLLLFKSYSSGFGLDYYKKYYFILFFLIIFSLLTFFLPKNFKINMSIALFSGIIGIYLIELILIIILSKFSSSIYSAIPNLQDHYNIYKNETGKEYDKRTKVQVYKDMKFKNSNVTMAYIPKYFIQKEYEKYNFFPLSGESNKHTILCNENGYYAIYKSDRFGFNNPDQNWNHKNFDKVLIGDSFVHGACVNYENTIAGKLKKFNEKDNILNLGIGSTGPLIQLGIFKEFLLTSKNDIKQIFWFYYEGNDLDNLSNEKKDPLLIKYLNDENFSQNLILKQPISNKIVNELISKKFIEKKQKKDEIKSKKIYDMKIKEIKTQKKFNKISFLNFLELKFVRLNFLEFYLDKEKRSGKNWGQTDKFFRSFLGLKPNTDNDLVLTDFKKILKIVKNLSQDHNTKFHFVYLPSRDRFLGLNNHPVHEKKNDILKIIKNLDISLIDIDKEIFQKHPDPLSFFPFRSQPHYTKDAYEKIATHIIKKTKN